MSLKAQSATDEQLKFLSLGASGLKVSPIILGCMSYGYSSNESNKWILDDEEEIFTIMKAAYDAGVRTWDTANTYSAGESERWIGKFIKKYNIPRHKLVILSNCFFRDDMPNISPPNLANPTLDQVNNCGLSRKHIFDAVERSVERLGTYIDVLQIHRYDSTVSDEEVMRALNDVVDSGKVRYIGASSMYAYQFIGLQNTAEKHGWHKFISMQNNYSAVYREEEREMIPYCKRTGVALIPYSPLSKGVLARPRTKAYSTDRFLSRPQHEKSIIEGPNSGIIDRVEELANKYGVTMAIIATSWIISKGTIPILGLSKVERLQEAIQATKFKLSEEDIKYLDELYSPVPVVGNL